MDRCSPGQAPASLPDLAPSWGFSAADLGAFVAVRTGWGSDLWFTAWGSAAGVILGTAEDRVG